MYGTKTLQTPIVKISKTHQKFSDRLKEPKALTNPEDFLGPNWRDVINFWLYFDTLNEEEIDKIGKSYWVLEKDVLKSAEDAAWDSSEEVVGLKVRSAACWAAYVVTDLVVFDFATNELICHHKLLEQNKTLVFLPLCLNP